METLQEMPKSKVNKDTDEKSFGDKVLLARAQSREAARKQLAEAQESGDEESIAAAKKEMDNQYGNYSRDAGDGVAPELLKIMDDASTESRDKSLVGADKAERGAAAVKEAEAAAYETLESDLERLRSEGEERVAKQNEERAEAKKKQEKESESALQRLRDLMSGKK